MGITGHKKMRIEGRRKRVEDGLKDGNEDNGRIYSCISHDGRKS
jgi:hypothetical protein